MEFPSFQVLLTATEHRSELWILVKNHTDALCWLHFNDCLLLGILIDQSVAVSSLATLLLLCVYIKWPSMFFPR